MQKFITPLLTILIVSLGCTLSGLGGDSASATPPPQGDNRCGDGICDGPENAQNCAEDCPAGGLTLPEQGSTEEDSPAPEAQPAQQETSEFESGFRYVSFGGSIDMTLNTALMGDFSGIAFEYAGDYQIELWFPPEGGEAVQQRNTIALTELRDLYFDSEPCLWELNESAFEPVSFELAAALILNGIQEDGEAADELSYQLTAPLNAVIGGVVTCQGSPGEFSDPAAYPVLTTWFMQGLTNPIHLNVVETNTVDQQPAGPTYFVSIPKETLSYVVVPDLNTP